MPYVRIWVHVVWSTKYRKPWLEKEIRAELISHILEHARIKNILIDSLNGYVDHLHALLALKVNQDISSVMQIIKGESVFWMNKNKIIKKRFAWQDGYYAISTDKSGLPGIRKYIKYQEAHHTNKSWGQEIGELTSDEAVQLFR